MRFRLGLVTGLATGYYLGTRAGRQRYDQINRQLTRLKRSDAFEDAAERARSVVTDGVEKAKSLVDSRFSDDAGSDPSGSFGTADGQGADGLVLPGQAPPATTAERLLPGSADLGGMPDGALLPDPTLLVDPPTLIDSIAVADPIPPAGAPGVPDLADLGDPPTHAAGTGGDTGLEAGGYSSSR